MILFLYGKDTFRSKQQARKMLEKFRLDRDPQGLNNIRLDCTVEPLGKIMEQIMAAPFLAEKRFVVLERLLESKHVDLRTDLLKRMSEGTLPEDTILLFWEGLDTVRSKEGKAFLARLAKEKYAQRFDLLEGSTLSGWVMGEVTERGGAIDNTALQFIVSSVGNDIWHLHTLIDQLLAYTDGETITLADVKFFVEEKVDDNIFNLVDAIVGQQMKQVFRMIQEQYRQGKDAQYVFAMILRQFRILLELRDLLDRDELGVSDMAAKRLGLHPFVVKKSLPLVKRYSMEKLRGIYEELLQFDIDIKTGSNDPGLLLDLFVGRVGGNVVS